MAKITLKRKNFYKNFFKKHFHGPSHKRVKVLVFAQLCWLLLLFIVQCCCQNNFSDCKIEQSTLSNGMEVLFVQHNSFSSSHLRLITDTGRIRDNPLYPGVSILTAQLIGNILKTSDIQESFADLVKQSHGAYKAFTKLEHSEFSIDIYDEAFPEISCLFASLFVNPVFTSDMVAMNILDLDNQFYEYMITSAEKYKHLFFKNITSVFPESHLMYFNRNKLLCTDFVLLVSSFFENFYTADRMKLVIASKLPLKNLKTIADEFSKISPAFVESIKGNKIKGQTLTALSRLLDGSVPSYLKKTYKAKIVKFHSESNNNLVFINYTFCPFAPLYKHVLIKYLANILLSENTDSIKEELISKDLIANMSIEASCRNRMTFIEICIQVTQKGKNSINEIMLMLVNLFNFHIPDRKIFDKVTKKFYESSLNSQDELNTVLFYKNIMADHEFESYINFDIPTFDQKLISAFFKKLGNVNNCTIWEMVNDPSLEQQLSYYHVKYGKPCSLNLDSNATSNLDVAITQENAFGIVKNNSFENGKCLLVQNNDLCPDTCIITLEFVSPENNFQNFTYENFNCFLFDKTELYIERQKLKCRVKAGVFVFNDNFFQFKGQKQDVLKAIDYFVSITKSDELSTFDLQSAHFTMSVQLLNQNDAPIKNKLINALVANITKKSFNYPVSCSPPLKVCFHTSYYTVIKAVGAVTQDDVISIYNKLKSTGTAEMYTNLNTNNDFYNLQSSSVDSNNFLFAFKVNRSDFLTELALALIFIELTREYPQNMHSDNNKNIQFVIADQIWIRGNLFVYFTVSDITFASRSAILLRIKTGITDQIKKLSFEAFTELKKACVRKFTNKMQDLKDLQQLANLIHETGICGMNLYEVLHNTIMSISKEEFYRKHPLRTTPVFITDKLNI